MNCWVQILFIYFMFLLWRWCFSARENMVIWLHYLLSMFPTTTASIYTIYIPDTLFHTVWIYIRFIYVLTRLSLEF